MVKFSWLLVSPAATSAGTELPWLFESAATVAPVIVGLDVAVPNVMPLPTVALRVVPPLPALTIADAFAAV